MSQEALEAVMAEINSVRCERHGEHSIELDCAPGITRPWDLIEGVVRGTAAAEQIDPSVQAAFFGHQVWLIKGLDCDTWDKVQKVTKPRIEQLYHSGRIRYGSW